jgi:hypothetical protein
MVLCGAALIAAFAGCSGALQDVPGKAQAKTAASIRALRVHPEGHGCRQDAGTLFASGNVTGNLDAYCGAGKGPIRPNEMRFQGIETAGWGLAVDRTSKFLAVGVRGGTVDLYNVLAFGAPHVLTLGHAGNNAFALSWDAKGGLYATEFPNQYLDYFGTPWTESTPTCVYTSKLIARMFSVAAGGTSVDIYGEGNGSAVYVINLVNGSTCAGPEKVIASFGSGVPGGLATNHAGRVVANDQVGVLYDLGRYPGGTPVASCTWPSGRNELTNITFDAAGNIWGAAAATYGTFPTYLVSFRYPFQSGGDCVSPGPSGGPTLQVSGDEYFGVAATRYAIHSQSN